MPMREKSLKQEKRMKRKGLFIGLIAFVLLIGVADASVFTQMIPEISIESDTVCVGDTFDVAVNVSDASNIGNVAFDLDYNGAALALMAEPALGSLATNALFATNPEIFPDTSGVLRLNMIKSTGITGDGEILRLTFIAIDTVSDTVVCSLIMNNLSVADLNSSDVAATKIDGTLTIVGVEEEIVVSLIPTVFALLRNLPNPFTFVTSIKYQLPVESHVSLNIYSYTGALVRTLLNTTKEAGYYTIHWDGKDNSEKKVASGIYFYKLETSDYTETRKMILVR
jgi:hypothetical protein